jgi:transcription initiation factor TFIID subunit 7
MEKRPTLKLKLPSGRAFPIHPSDNPQPTATPSMSTPKIKLKFGGSKTPSIETPMSTKPTPAPSAKKTTQNGSTPKKRRKAENGEDQYELAQDAIAVEPKPKKLKVAIKVKKLKSNNPEAKAMVTKPRFVAKLKGKAPTREPGVGYDSEASDREDDPAIEEEIILRMQPGEDCEYLRKAIEERRFGLRKDGGADVHMKFLQKDGRRAAVVIRGRMYAASLVDLPCIVEGMKSWDKKGWWKSADICQMLLVLGRVKDENEAKIFPLPKEVEAATFQYAHGLTPPMYRVRKRRFRKRISNRTIEAVEDEVNRLLEADENCFEYVKNEIVDLAEEAEEDSEASEDDDNARHLLDNAGLEEAEYDDEDAEGEYEEVSYINGNGEADAEGDFDAMDELQMELEKHLAEEGSEALSFEVNGDGSGMGESSAVVTPAAQIQSADDTSGDEDDGDEEDDVDDDDLKEQQQVLAQQREEIADLEAAIRTQTIELERQTNPILKQKVMKKIQSLKADLQLKKEAIGEGDD